MTLTGLLLALLFMSPLQAGGQFCVNSLGDHLGTCPTDCTLRTAIQGANSQQGPDSITQCTTGTIELESNLPSLVGETHLALPGITLTGEADNGLMVSGDNSTITGLTVDGFTRQYAAGVVVSGNNVTITDLDASGSPFGLTWIGANGILALSRIAENTIDGINVHASAAGLVVDSCEFVDQVEDGVFLAGTPDVVVRNSLIRRNGTQTPSGTWSGISATDAPRLVVEDCLIGTDGTGAVAEPNGTGIRIRGNSPDVTIRSSTVSGNESFGVDIGPGATNLRIEDSRIGRTADDTADLCNGIEQLVDAGTGTTLEDVSIGCLPNPTPTPTPIPSTPTATPTMFYCGGP